MDPIYLDHAATSPIHPKVIEAMLPYYTEFFGNPSSIHHFGRQARHALDEARHRVATSIKAKANEIIFTSGGTEADNLAIFGITEAYKNKGNHIITTSIEHHAVLHACHSLEKQGFDVTYLPVDEFGQVSLQDLENALREDTILVSIMYGNNEVGTLQSIKQFGTLLKEKDIIFHSDAVQAFGSLDINVNDLHLDLMSVSAHKINGPKGVGALYIREGLTLTPNLYGGEQERKRRAGTENIAGIVGFSKAVELALDTMNERSTTYQSYQETIINIFDMEGIHYQLNGPSTNRLPHIINVCFPGCNVETMLTNLDLTGIAASSGSACTAGSIDPSHVLTAMFGKQSTRVLSSIRFSFGLGNTKKDIEIAAEKIVNIVKRIQK